MSSPPQVAAGRRPLVAVLTYRRHDELRLLLPVLQAQCRAAVPPWDILVVDNDPEAGAREVVVEKQGVTYVHEPRPGIASARNRALAEAEGAPLLVFLDDDERPCDGWLASLLHTHATTGATGVVGPVLSEFVAPVGRWVVEGRVFDRRRLTTGDHVQVAATNNLLLDLVQVRALGLSFDERFGLTGGSDTLFTRQLVTRGGTIVWCNEALVVDLVPPNRATRTWVLRRARRSGNTWARTSLLMAPGPTSALVVRLRLVGAGAARVVGGGLRVVHGLLTRSLGRCAQGERAIARGWGMLTGAIGMAHIEYGRPKPE